jgi:hypothetical protein
MRDVATRDLEFFRGVPQRLITVAGYVRPTPAFYYDFSETDVLLATPLDRIREVLPSRRLHPLRLTPRSGVIMIMAADYRDSDLGPYRAVLIGFPVSVDRNAPVTTELRRYMARGGSLYIWQMPVTTGIARDVGAETAGLRRFQADIDFADESGVATCRLAEGGKCILTLQVRHRPPVPRETRLHTRPVTVEGGRLLGSTAITRIPRAAVAFNGRGVSLELGDHPLADQLRHLSLGRVIMASYGPANQSILSPTLESWPLE